MKHVYKHLLSNVCVYGTHCVHCWWWIKQHFYATFPFYIGLQFFFRLTPPNARVVHCAIAHDRNSLNAQQTFYVYDEVPKGIARFLPLAVDLHLYFKIILCWRCMRSAHTHATNCVAGVLLVCVYVLNNYCWRYYCWKIQCMNYFPLSQPLLLCSFWFFFHTLFFLQWFYVYRIRLEVDFLFSK